MDIINHIKNNGYCIIGPDVALNRSGLSMLTYQVNLWYSITPRQYFKLLNMGVLEKW